MKHELLELIFIIGLFLTLLACIAVEVAGVAHQEADMSSIIHGLMIILTGAGGHFFGRKSAEKTQNSVSEPLS